MSQFKDDVVATEVVYFWFAANLTTGAAGDGATPLYDVRLAGGAAGDAPTASGTPTLLTHANYTDGLHEIAVDTTGYANGEYAVFCTLTISTVNPAGFVGSFRVRTANRIDAIKTKTDFLPSATAGDAGGVFIAGTNAACTITGALVVSNGIDVSASTTNRAGVAIAGNGTAPGLFVAGGSTGDGIRAESGISGSGTVGISAVGHGTAGIGLKAAGADSGAGLSAVGGDSGAGILATGGATSGSGLKATAGGGGVGIEAAGIGANGHGINAYGQGGVSSNGIQAVSGGGLTGSGISAASTSSNGAGFSVLGTGSGPGFLATGGSSGAGIRALSPTAGDGLSLEGIGGNDLFLSTPTTNLDDAMLTAIGNVAAAVWDIDATTHQTGGTFGQAIGDPAADTHTIYDAVVTAAAGVNVAADIIAIKAETVNILADTAEIGTAGAGLTNINLPDQTMDITGNLSGSVGSVTGNVVGTIGGLTATAIKDFFDTDSTTTYASAVAGSVVKEIADNAGGTALSEAGIAAAVWDLDATAHQTTGTFGQAIGDPAADTHTIYDAVVTAAAGVNIAADIVAVKADTAEIGVAGAGLTNINLPDQTMNITGNLSGSVGSVTGLTASNLDATVSSRATQTSVDDLPTNSELATALGTADDAVLAAIAALNNISTAQVNAEVVDALATDTYAEPTGVPAATASIATKLGRLHQALRNALDVTATDKTFYNDSGSAIWKKPLSDDGSTYSEAEGTTP